MSPYKQKGDRIGTGSLQIEGAAHGGLSLRLVLGVFVVVAVLRKAAPEPPFPFAPHPIPWQPRRLSLQ